MTEGFALGLKKEAFRSYPSRFRVKVVPLKRRNNKRTTTQRVGHKYLLTTTSEVNQEAADRSENPYNPFIL